MKIRAKAGHHLLGFIEELFATLEEEGIQIWYMDGKFCVEHQGVMWALEDIEEHGSGCCSLPPSTEYKLTREVEDKE